MLYVLVILIVLFCVLLMAKNDNAYKNRMKISQAIYDRQQALIRKAYNYDDPEFFKIARLVNYSDIECYFKTVFRLWDWGYTRILPEDKFKLIKPYIY